MSDAVGGLIVNDDPWNLSCRMEGLRSVVDVMMIC
jgi:hypothetical protein